jgi:hypothetical protein
VVVVEVVVVVVGVGVFFLARTVKFMGEKSIDFGGFLLS